MTKAVIGNKEQSTKKQIKKQSGIKQESFSKEGAVASYGAQKSSQRKAGKFSKERTVSLGVRKSKKGVITQRKQLLT